MDYLYFFGRFNFPHYGYLYVIREAIKQLAPTHGITIVFSIEHATWEKHAIPLKHRQAMFEAAIQELPRDIRSKIHFSSIEYELQKKMSTRYGGYTIDTLRELTKKNIGTSGLIMGADAMIGIPGIHAGLTAWKDWKEIQKNATLVTLPRGRYKTVKDIQQNVPAGLDPMILDTKPNEIELHASSTAIQNGNYTFLPTPVHAYATSHSLLIQY